MIIAWFSGGVTSAVATKLAVAKYHSVLPIFIETGSHHPDSKRFFDECQDWLGQTIMVVRDKRFKDHIDLVRKLRYVNGPYGAECSRTLKKRVRQSLEKVVEFDGQVFGFEFEKKEVNRAVRFKEQNPAAKPLFPLIDKKLNKAGCMAILEKAGIRVPEMYRLGFSNNNCIDCVKGGMGYWNRVRKEFPDWFDRMAEAEREVGRSCIKGVFLDELDPKRGRDEKQVLPECDLFCEIEAADIVADETKEIMGEL